MTPAPAPRDAGVTLIELLVASALFVVLGSVLLGLTLSTDDVTRDIRSRTGVVEESRVAMERMSRELRQAGEVTAVQLPTTADPAVSITFWTDFDGDRVQSPDAVDPELMTYRWSPVDHHLELTAGLGEAARTTDLLAAEVTALVLDLRSSHWELDRDPDGDGPQLPDGVTTWQELDDTPGVGNANDRPDGTELDYVDLVRISVTVTSGEAEETYHTQVDLRNRS